MDGQKDEEVEEDDGVLNFQSLRQRLDENANRVRCARCGKWILASDTTCPKCGVHFHGEAQDFSHGADRKPAKMRTLWIVAAIAALIAIFLLSLLPIW